MDLERKLNGGRKVNPRLTDTGHQYAITPTHPNVVRHTETSKRLITTTSVSPTSLNPTLKQDLKKLLVKKKKKKITTKESVLLRNKMLVNTDAKGFDHYLGTRGK